MYHHNLQGFGILPQQHPLHTNTKILHQHKRNSNLPTKCKSGSLFHQILVERQFHPTNTQGK